MNVEDWTLKAARLILFTFDMSRHHPQDTSVPRLAQIIQDNCPFKPDTAYVEVCREPIDLDQIMQPLIEKLSDTMDRDNARAFVLDTLRSGMRAAQLTMIRVAKERARGCI